MNEKKYTHEDRKKTLEQKRKYGRQYYQKNKEEIRTRRNKSEGHKKFKDRLELIREKWNISLDFKTKKQIIRETYNVHLSENKSMRERANHNTNYEEKNRLKEEREAMNPFMQKLQDCLQEADFITFENIFINS